MAEAGILSEDDRVELLDGEILEMVPIGTRHAACVKRLNSIFTSAVGGRAIVSVQDPIRLGPLSEPQPDLALLRPRSDFYASAHPDPENVLLVVEVADTSVDFDRETKLPLYARSGIPEVWLVDLQSGVLDICRGPSPNGYGDVRRCAPGQQVSPVAFPLISVAVEAVLGRGSRG